MPRKSRQNRTGNNMHHDEQWQKAWREPGEIETSRKNALLNSINDRIDHNKRKRNRLFFIGISAAAAILIAVFIKVPDNGVRTPEITWKELASNDSTQKVLLDDGSSVWLAPHSALRVYGDFVHQRTSLLTKGTVFFSVAKDAQHPFSIGVNGQQVTVVGTAFTIHKLDSVDLQLTVKEGKVALDNPGGRLFLTAGQQVNTTRAITGIIQKVDPAAADWWLQQQIRLQKITIEELLNRVETYYRVKLSHGHINSKLQVTLTWDLSIPLKDNLTVLNSLTGYNIH